MKLVSPTQYVREATEAINNATSRVYLLSMVLANHKSTEMLIDAIKAAAKRGVKVVVAADIFTYGEVSDGFLAFRYYSPGGRNTSRMVKSLKKAGVKFSWLGRGRVTIFHGRTHSKWCIVDDLVFAFGGVNLYDQGVNNTDYMLRIDDSHLANRLVDEQVRLQKADLRSINYPSTIYEHNELKVLIDGGIIGQSVIYRRAIELAEQAESIQFVSQYCPTGRLARILKKKSTGLYFNRPVQASGLNRVVIRVAQALTGLKTAYRQPRYLHAKLIIYTMKDGTKTALTGSHNFAHTGVLLGTREIALETNEPAIVDQLERFIWQEIDPEAKNL